MSETSAESATTEASPAAGTVQIRMFGRTDVGMVREHNEDNFLIADLSQNIRGLPAEVRTHTVGSRGTLFAVCDGMGGAAAGEVASQMAVDTIHDLVQNGPEPANRDQFGQRMSYAIGEAGARIFLAAKSNRAQRGMGTTSTVAGVYGKTLFVGQVGDSRAYLVRKSKIKQITKDQSLVSKLIEAGQLTEAEAESYEHSHIILQALGTADTVSVDLTYIDLCRGDAVLLCSDGLSGLVTAEQMRETLTTLEEPMEACKRLTDLANEAGGHDNITVIVARFDGDLPEPEGALEQFGYQPYVIAHPIDQGTLARASGKIKGADLPPPGKDVKNAVSMRPPPMSGAMPSPVAPRPGIAGTDDDVQLPMSNSPRVVMAALLVAVIAAVALGGFYLFKRPAQGGSGTPGVPAAGSVDSGAPRPAPSTTVPAVSLDAGSVRTEIPAPSGVPTQLGATGADASAAAPRPIAADASAHGGHHGSHGAEGATTTHHHGGSGHDGGT